MTLKESCQRKGRWRLLANSLDASVMPRFERLSSLSGLLNSFCGLIPSPLLSRYKVYKEGTASSSGGSLPPNVAWTLTLAPTLLSSSLALRKRGSGYLQELQLPL